MNIERIGVSTACLYPMPLEEAFIQLAESGFKVIDIFFNSPSELKEGFISKLKQIKDYYGITVPATHPFTSSLESMLFFSDYERRFYDCLDLYSYYYQAAAALDAKYLILHGDRSQTCLDMQQFAERFLLLRERGRQYKVELVQENIGKFRSGSLKFIREIKEIIKDIGFVFDIKQAIRASVDPLVFCQTMGANNIRHIHANDFNAEFDCLPPGKGDFDFSSLYKIIENNKTDCYYIIELYRSNFGEIDELIRSKKYLERIFDKFRNVRNQPLS